MLVAQVIGKAVSTVKDDGLRAATLLVCRPADLTGKAGDGEPFVAVDACGAGEGELVLVALGSAAREVARLSGPVDAAVVAIVDAIDADGKRRFTKGG